MNTLRWFAGVQETLHFLLPPLLLVVVREDEGVQRIRLSLARPLTLSPWQGKELSTGKCLPQAFRFRLGPN